MLDETSLDTPSYIVIAVHSQLTLLELAMRVGQGLGAFVARLFFDANLQGLHWLTLICVAAVLAVGLLAFERSLTPTENGRPA